MTTILPVFAGDVYLLLNQLRWIKQLGGAHGHHAIICADAGLEWSLCNQAVTLAQESFDSVSVIINEQTVPGWIAGSNSLWVTAAKFCQAQKIDGWLWLEPDAVPIKKGWLDQLEKAWSNANCKILGALYACNQPGLPPTMVSGVSIYSADAISLYPGGKEAFDVQLSRGAADQCDNTELFQHFWGMPGLPPTFRHVKTLAPRHAFTLEKLKPEAVVFHRQKDGTLIELLRKENGIAIDKEFLVALPVCVKDADLLLKALAWMTELDGQNQFDCLIAYDTTLGPAWMSRLRAAAQRAFRTVFEFQYNRPIRENWPDACNVAFQATANHINTVHKRSWLWFEADCVPLKPDWLPALWQEYQNCGYPIAGPVIDGVGHMNGTAIYPANFANLSPRAMSATSEAWDTAMTSDIVGKVHDLSRLFCHRWGIVNGMLHQSQGTPPHFSSPLSVDQWIPKDAVIFHRCKDGSLIDQLRARKK